MPVVTLVLLLARLILVGIFVVSAVAKLLDRPGSKAAALDFGVPAPLAGLVAAGLPVAELLCAALLVSADPGASAGALLSILLLASFTVAIVVNLVRGRRPDCHCFGQLSAAPTGWPTVARNGALLVLAVLPLLAVDSLPSVPAQIASYPAGERLLGMVIGGLVIAVLVLGALFRTVMGRYGAVLLRLEALESAAAPGAPVPAPPFELPDLDGETVSLDEVLAEQRPVLLVFISPSCTICAELLPDLQRWQTPEHPLSVVVLSVGTVEANRAKLEGIGGLRVLLQADREVSTAYGSKGSPGAFMIGVDGLIAGAGAYGLDAIRQLHDSMVAAIDPDAAHHHHAATPSRHPSAGVGDPVPSASVRTEAGDEIDLVELTDAETVLLFWATNCGFCSRIVSEVAELERETSVLLVSISEPAEIRATGLTSPVVRDLNTTLRSILQVPGTPAAVAVRDRVIASEAAIGGPDVLAMLSRHSHSLQS